MEPRPRAAALFLAVTGDRAFDSIAVQGTLSYDCSIASKGPELNDEFDRLARLEGRQLDFIDEIFSGRRDARSIHRREQRERRVRNLFRDYQEWIRDAMTTADEPFLQVVAVLVGC